MQVGPLDANLNVRPTAWNANANLIFIDSPVGTGYSYVDDPSLLTTTNEQIATDLLAVFKNLTAVYPELAKNPFYILTERCVCVVLRCRSRSSPN